MKYARNIEQGERVRVHRNLNNGMMSVLSWNNKYNDKARVIGHVYDISLKDCKFIVQPAGSKKAKQTGQRNVHAFIEGTVTKRKSGITYDGDIYYNAFKSDSFILVDQNNNTSKIKNCELVDIRDGKYVNTKL